MEKTLEMRVELLEAELVAMKKLIQHLQDQVQCFGAEDLESKLQDLEFSSSRINRRD